MSRRNALRAIPALASALVALGGGAATTVAVAETAHTAKATVTVTATDYKFKLSPNSLSKPETVTFKVLNKGQTSHDFKIDGKTTKLIAPGQSTTLTVSLKKGSYPYLCTVPGHAALGMKGTFKVG